VTFNAEHTIINISILGLIIIISSIIFSIDSVVTEELNESFLKFKISLNYYITTNMFH